MLLHRCICIQNVTVGSIKVLNKISGPPAGNMSSHQVKERKPCTLDSRQNSCCRGRGHYHEEEEEECWPPCLTDTRVAPWVLVGPARLGSARLAWLADAKFHWLPECKRVAPRGTKGVGSADKLITALRGHGKDIKRRREKQRAGGEDGGGGGWGGEGCHVCVTSLLLAGFSSSSPFVGGRGGISRCWWNFVSSLVDSDAGAFF